jgi:DNA-binding CsgD family transcriptional regulator
MLRNDTAPTRINDLEPASFLASARTEPLHNRRERELLDLFRNGHSVESLQRRSGYHPSQLWALLNLHRGTAEAERQYAAALALYHHMRSITERDDL